MNSLSTISAAAAEVEVVVSSTSAEDAPQASVGTGEPVTAAVNLSKVKVIRPDGTGMDASRLLEAREEEKGKTSNLKRFYQAQNALIDALVADLEPEDKGALAEMEEAPEKPQSRPVRRAIQCSFVLNVLLLAAKIVAAIASGSMAAIASTADSLLDLVSGVVMMLTQRAMNKVDKDKYPEGKARLEPLGVVVFAAVMGMSSLQIIVEAAKRIASIISSGPTLDLTPSTIIILGSTILTKFIAFVVCRAVSKQHASESVDAYAQDHFNDVMTNTVGVVAIILAWASPDHLGLLDPIGAILIGIWIIYSWLTTALEQISKLAGLTAPPDFLRRLTHIVFTHDARVQKVDTVRAYHFGSKFLCEVEIVMAPDTKLRESHDIGILLQHKIERLAEVERAYVHVDYQIRKHDDHDPRTPIEKKTTHAHKSKSDRSVESGRSTTSSAGAMGLLGAALARPHRGGAPLD
jgi:cation diffusion facilitator family transporter